MSETCAWEYRAESMGQALRGPSDEEIEATLDRLGLEGWEAVAVLPRESSYRLTAVLKRPLGSSPRPRSGA